MIGYQLTLVGIPDLAGNLKITYERLRWGEGQYEGLPFLPLHNLLPTTIARESYMLFRKDKQFRPFAEQLMIASA